MNNDAPSRRFAVAARIDETADGRLRLVLDDLEAVDSDNQEWRRWAFFTTMELDKNRSLSHSLSDDEYSRIGHAVMARLAALGAIT
jgi:hypothetical protein